METMEKTVIIPEWYTVESEELDEAASAYGVITQRSGYRHVSFSGGVALEGDIKEQTRTILSHKQDALEYLGGSMSDIVTLRCFVLADILSSETQGGIHEARAEFFERPNYPASTMVGVAGLLHDDALIEIEVEAEIPEEEWDTEVITSDE
jgi:enamine deaminase RidA (YjgF/YER057c/UK114 family)